MTSAYDKRRGRLVQLWISEDALEKLRARSKADTRTISGWARRVLYAALGIESRNDGGIEPADVECPTCLGVGKLRDGESGELRACLDCRGSGRQ